MKKEVYVFALVVFLLGVVLFFSSYQINLSPQSDFSVSKKIADTNSVYGKTSKSTSIFEKYFGGDISTSDGKEPNPSKPEVSTETGELEVIDGEVEDFNLQEVPPVLRGDSSSCTADGIYVCDVANLLPETFTGCYGDADGNGFVNPGDRGFISVNFGTADYNLICKFDMDGNNFVNPGDRGFISVNFGLCTQLPDFQDGSGNNHGLPDTRFPVMCGDGCCNLASENSTGCFQDCGSGEQCGNGNIDSEEICDGINLNGTTCISLGYAGGTLGCLSDCLGFNVTSCTTSENQCDSNALRQQEYRFVYNPPLVLTPNGDAGGGFQFSNNGNGGIINDIDVGIKINHVNNGDLYLQLQIYPVGGGGQSWSGFDRSSRASSNYFGIG